MKKILLISLSFLIFYTTFACIILSTPSDILYLLNWGEYIDEDLVKNFEEEYHCQVIEEDVTSSEAMFQKITSKTTTYDVAIPADYTVTQLYEGGFLKELDVTNDTLENLSSYQSIFQDDLNSLIQKDMVDTQGNHFSSYFMPYFYGSYCLLYSEEKDDVKDVVTKNGFASLYDRSLYKEDVRLGMYSNARWIVSSYLLAKGYNPNITSFDGTIEDDLSDEVKQSIVDSLRQVKFDEFGDDSLKRNVANSSLDVCFTQSGDFYDVLYLSLQQKNKDINFSLEIPKKTAAFFDSMVIPTTCHDEKLANLFINYMLEPSNAYQNARTIGYSPTLKSVSELFVEDSLKGVNYYEDRSFSYSLKDFLLDYPLYLDPLKDAQSFTLLKPKSKDYLTTCETIFNNLA